MEHLDTQNVCSESLNWSTAPPQSAGLRTENGEWISISDFMLFFFNFLFTDCFCAVWLKTASFRGWQTKTAAALTCRLPARSPSERGVLINTLGAMERERYASSSPPPLPPPSFYSISTFIHLSSPPLTSAWLSVFPHVKHGGRREERHAQHRAELWPGSTHCWTHMSHVHYISV